MNNPIRYYPDCEIGFSRYDKEGKLIGLATKEDCLHCREDKELNDMQAEAVKRAEQLKKY